MSYSDVMSAPDYYSTVMQEFATRSWFTPSSKSLSVAETPNGKPMMGSIKLAFQPGWRIPATEEMAQANAFAKAQYSQNTRSTHTENNKNTPNVRTGVTLMY